MKLDELFTSREVMEICGLEYPQQLTSGHGLRGQYELETVKVGGSLGFPREEVKRLLRLEFGVPPDEADQRLDELAAVVALERGTDPVSAYWVADEAQELLGGISREALYQNSDFRGGLIQTVRFGRTRLYRKEDVEHVAGHS